MKKEFKLYVLRDPRDGMIRYVGVTKRTLCDRLVSHIKDRRVNHRTCWLKSLKKEALIPEIELIKSYSTEEEVFKAEIQAIKLYRGCRMNLVNSCDGGKGRLNPTNEARRKISEKLKGNPKLATQKGKSPTKESIDKARTTRNNWSEEKKLQNSINRSNANIGKVLSPETKKKISISKKGKPPYNKGKSMPVEQIKKQQKAIIDQNGKEYESLKDAAVQTGVSKSSVSAVVTNRLKSVKGYIFKYKEIK